MKKKLKKIFGFLLALVLCVESMGMTAAAAEGNVWHGDKIKKEIKAGENGYTFISAYDKVANAYEMSNHMVSLDGENHDIPQLLMLVDASKEWTWTPDGPYSFGESNYEVLYCCDAVTGYNTNNYYKRVNLEDSTYYNEASARRIRSIVTNSYPYVSLETMKANLAADGFVGAEKLTRAEIITAVQSAIWSYSNKEEGVYRYSRSFNVPDNTQWGTVVHDYTNEMQPIWWNTGKKVFTTNEEVGERIDSLVTYLRTMNPVAITKDEIVISNIEVLRSEPVSVGSELYNITLKVTLNTTVDAEDDIKLTVTAGESPFEFDDLDDKNNCEITIQAKEGDTIKTVLDGTQILPKGVYLYEPEGGRDISQTLVGVGQGETSVYAEQEFVFEDDIEMGIRIYKRSSSTGKPIEGITFKAYKVPEGAEVSTVPTEEEIAEYKVDANFSGEGTTDANGYAAIDLLETGKGVYLVVEEHNKDKVKAPVAPFYVALPMKDSDNDTNLNIVAVTPKNDPTDPEDPGDDVLTGSFSILKHSAGDEAATLAGAEFQLYRPATSADAGSVQITYKENSINVVPVKELVTDEDGKAYSGELEFGTYFVVETKAPTGYMIDTTPIRVNLSEKTDGIEIKFANEPLFELPETGGAGTTAIYVLGMTIMLAATFLLIRNKKKSYNA